jgi:hypothetical protein
MANSLSCLLDIRLLSTNDDITYYVMKKSTAWLGYSRAPVKKLPSFMEAQISLPYSQNSSNVNWKVCMYVANPTFSRRHQIKVNRFMLFKESNDQIESSNNLSDFYSWSAQVQYLLRHDLFYWNSSLFSSSLHTNAGILPQIRRLTFPSAFLPIYYSLGFI